MFPLTPEVDARFRKWVREAGPNDCWFWLGTPLRLGYGQFSIHDRSVLAHRIAWERRNNRQIPTDMLVCHSCDNPSCVNPRHLWLGFDIDNIGDCIKKGRRASNQASREHHDALLAARMTFLMEVRADRAVRSDTHCLRGHPFAGQKPWPGETGTLRCKVCHNEAAAIRHRAKRAKARAERLAA